MNHELAPLRDRVEAPQEVARPVGPDGIHWRSLTREDAGLLTELAERISTRDHPAWSESLEEMRDELEHSWVDPETDGVLGIDHNGRAVAWGLVVVPPNAETLLRTFLFGGVDPQYRGRGIGRRLLVWQHERAREKLAHSESRLPAWELS